MTQWTLIRKNRCTSTNDLAKKLPAYSVISACHQTKGRGRLGRKWQDGKGNLMASLVLPKPKKDIHLYTFLISLAVARSIRSLSPKIKWPNDILIQNKKVCGILLEATQDTLIIGIGVNIDTCPDTGMMYPVTCLKAHRMHTSYKQLLENILQNFDNVIQLFEQNGFEPIRQEWLALACGLHQQISVNLPSQTIKGIFEGINEMGALLLAVPNNQVIQITAGDVFLIKDE